MASWAEGRSAFVTGELETTEPVQLTRGLPQGSPLSPVVFLLFLAPAFGTSSRFGYVDNIARAAVPAEVKVGRLEGAEVFESEVVAIHRAVKRLTTGRPTSAVVYSDNLAAVEARKMAAPGSQAEALAR